MTLRPHHLRALAAAAGLVGRPRLRAGLLLTLATGCVPEIKDPGDDTSEESSTAAESTGSNTAPSTTATTTSDTTVVTTGADTLLTDATTFASTGTGDTDESTGTDTGDSSGSTGGLGDCVDPRTGMTDWDCCEAQDWLPHPQCTPWGPPAPPAAGAARLQRARAARGRFV